MGDRDSALATQKTGEIASAGWQAMESDCNYSA